MNIDSSPLVSIIVPVYNVSRDLAECISSIRRQTYQDWQLVLVDDGSTDSSGIICDEFSAQDARIKVIHIPNGGVSNARNVGMANATGTWITFVDGDDWISDDFIEKLTQPVLQDPELDFVHCGCENYVEGKGFSVNQKYEHFASTDPTVLLQRFRGLVVSKLFKKSILEEYGIIFDRQVKLGEDYIFALDYMLHVKKYSFIPLTGYYYRFRESSVSHTTRNIPMSSYLSGFRHHVNSLQTYLAHRQVSNEVAAFRWSLVSNNVFYAIHLPDVFLLHNDQKKELLNLLKHYSLVSHQTSFKRKCFLGFVFLLLSVGGCLKL